MSTPLDYDDDDVNTYKIFTLYVGGATMGMVIFLCIYIIVRDRRRCCPNISSPAPAPAPAPASEPASFRVATHHAPDDDYTERSDNRRASTELDVVNLPL